MAVNALLYTWMKGDTLLVDTPAAVKETVDKASQWLVENTLSGKYKPWNAVFSGSVKSYAVSYNKYHCCLLYTSPSPRDATLSRMPSSA